jgi:hypothetical protein
VRDLGVSREVGRLGSQENERESGKRREEEKTMEREKTS